VDSRQVTSQPLDDTGSVTIVAKKKEIINKAA